MAKPIAPVWSTAKSKRDRKKIYLALLPIIRKIARKSGYAVGVHGSLTRDLDLIAVAWRDGAVMAETLAYRIHRATCRRPFGRAKLKKIVRLRAYGRVVYLLVLGPNGSYIDLSITR